MNDNFRKILYTAHPATQQTVIRFLKSESKQGVSDSPAQNGDLPRVGECNASGADTTKLLSESEHGTLDNITDDENIRCIHCNESYYMRKSTITGEMYCQQCWTSYMKSS